MDTQKYLTVLALKCYQMGVIITAFVVFFFEY